MLHRTGLLTEAQVRGSKPVPLSRGLCEQPSSVKHMIMVVAPLDNTDAIHMM